MSTVHACAASTSLPSERGHQNFNRLTRQDQQQDEETLPPPSILSQPVWSEDTMSGLTATRTATFVQALSETPLEAQLEDSKFKFISRSLYQQRGWPISDIVHDTLSGVFTLSFFFLYAHSLVFILPFDATGWLFALSLPPPGCPLSVFSLQALLCLVVSKALVISKRSICFFPLNLA